MNTIISTSALLLAAMLASPGHEHSETRGMIW